MESWGAGGHCEALTRTSEDLPTLGAPTSARVGSEVSSEGSARSFLAICEVGSGRRGGGALTSPNYLLEWVMAAPAYLLQAKRRQVAGPKNNCGQLRVLPARRLPHLLEVVHGFRAFPVHPLQGLSPLQGNQQRALCVAPRGEGWGGEQGRAARPCGWCACGWHAMQLLSHITHDPKPCCSTNSSTCVTSTHQTLMPMRPCQRGPHTQGPRAPAAPAAAHVPARTCLFPALAARLAYALPTSCTDLRSASTFFRAMLQGGARGQVAGVLLLLALLLREGEGAVGRAAGRALDPSKDHVRTWAATPAGAGGARGSLGVTQVRPNG